MCKGKKLLYRRTRLAHLKNNGKMIDLQSDVGPRDYETETEQEHAASTCHDPILPDQVMDMDPNDSFDSEAHNPANENDIPEQVSSPNSQHNQVTSNFVPTNAPYSQLVSIKHFNKKSNESCVFRLQWCP